LPPAGWPRQVALCACADLGTAAVSKGIASRRLIDDNARERPAPLAQPVFRSSWAAPCVADRDHRDEARGQFPQYEVTGGKFPLTMPA